MDHQMNAVLLQDLPLDIIDNIMAVHQLLRGAHLDMNAGKPPARPVIVHHQVVQPQHPVVAENLPAELVDQLLAGRLAEQRVQGLPHHADPAPEDEERDRHRDRPIQREPGHPGGHRGEQDAGGRDDIVAAVGPGRLQRGGADPPADRAVEHRHPELDEDREDQHRHRQQAEGDLLGVDGPLKSGAQQIHPDRHDQHRHRQPGEVLDPGVAERVFRVGRLAAQLETEQGDQAARRIRQVVDRIGHDRDAAEQKPGEKFAAAQKEITEQPHHPGKRAVPLPRGGGAGILRLFDEPPDQKFGHTV